MTLYHDIKDDIFKKISSGEYALGSVIPTELELAKHYGVSRATIRQALQILTTEGYLEKKKRKGTIVMQPKVEQSFTQKLQSFSSEMQNLHKSFVTKVISFKRETAKPEVAAALKLDEVSPDNKEVYKLVRLRFVDDLPNVFVESYIPGYAYPNLDEHDFTQELLYDVMDAMGGAVTRARRKLEVCLADRVSAALLEVSQGDPLFLFHSVGFNEKNTPVEYSIASYRGENNSFMMEATPLEATPNV